MTQIHNFHYSAVKLNTVWFKILYRQFPEYMQEMHTNDMQKNKNAASVSPMDNVKKSI